MAKQRSLKWHLAVFSCGITAPVALVAFAASALYVYRENEVLRGRAFDSARDAANLIDQELEKHIIALETLSTSSSLATGDLRAVYERSRKVSAQLRSPGIAMRDASGRALFLSIVPFGEPIDGTIAPQLNAADQKALETNRIVISDVFRARVSNEPVVAIVKPIKLNSEPAFLSLAISAERIKQALPARATRSDWLFGVTGNDDRMIFRGWETDRYTGQKPTDEFLRNTMGERGVFSAVTLEGIPVLNFYTRSKVAGWRVSVAIPAAIVNAPFYQALGLTSTILLLSIIASLTISALYSRRFTRPVDAMKLISTTPTRTIDIIPSGITEFDDLGKVLQNHQRQQATLIEGLTRAEEQFRLAVEAAPNGMVLCNGDGQIILVNGQIEKMLGYRRDELVGQNVDLLVPARFRERHPTDRENYVSHPSVRLMGTGRDVFARRKDGTELPVEIGLSPILTGLGTMVLCGIVDIADRKRAQESQQLVIRELQHRTQNLLTVVQTIANRSLDEAKTFAEAKYVMNGRLKALGQAYATLADAKWVGASLREIIDQQLAPMSNRISVNGCDIVVIPTAAQQFAMIVHELTTNALKYGALSVPDGRVSIDGTFNRDEKDGLFLFVWREIGGPAVSPPSRKGFGSVILLDSARHFGENVNADYLPTGLVYSLQVRLITIEAKPSLILNHAMLNEHHTG